MLALDNPFPQFVDLEGLPLQSGKLYFGVADLDPIANPITVYWDAAGTIPASQPLATTNGYIYRAGTPAKVYASGSFSLLVRNVRDETVFYDPQAQGGAYALAQELAAPAGSGTVGYNYATDYDDGTVGKALKRHIDAVEDFSCDNTGATNTSAALLAFYEECISTGKPGYIPAGIYKVTPGQLVFSCAFTDTQFPTIFTAGVKAVTFQVDPATSIDAPVMYWHNGTATSAVGQYWRDGYHGGFTISDSTGVSSPARHGLMLRGMYGTRWGWVRVIGARGDAFRIEKALYSVTNPDPYAVGSCRFEAMEAVSAKGLAFNNDNYVGFNMNYVDQLRATNCEGGVFRGAGAENRIGFISAGSCMGWAVDDGTSADIIGGRPAGLEICGAELDDVQYGFRLNAIQSYSIRARFIHRYNFSALNPALLYWPRKAVELGGGASPSTSGGTLKLVHRIEAGGVKANMGVFVDCSSSSGVTNMIVEQSVQDNAGFGFANSDLYANINSNAQLLLTRDGAVINDCMPKVSALVVTDTTATVPTAASAVWATAGAKITFATERYDIGGSYDSANSWYVIPFTGLYRFNATICFASAAGTRVRLGVALDRSGALAYAKVTNTYSGGASAQSYEVNGEYNFQAGDKVFVIADQSTAAPINLSAPLSASAELQFSIEAVTR